jgi:hypothetical protein
MLKEKGWVLKGISKCGNPILLHTCPTKQLQAEIKVNIPCIDFNDKTTFF